MSRTPYGVPAAIITLITVLTLLSFTFRAEIHTKVVSLKGQWHNDDKTAAATTTAHPAQDNHDEYLAICLAVKDQGKDMPEWLQHHYHTMGIKRFYIMDDGSNPPLSSMQHTFGVPEEALTFVYFPESEHVPNMQYKVYDLCASTYGVNNTWIAYIDADEFFDTPGGETMDGILKGLEPLSHIGALGVNWQMHTSSGRLTRAESVRAEYTECIYDDVEHNGDGSDNKHIKTIVKTANYGGAINPHQFGTKDSITAGEWGDEIHGGPFRQPITRERISLHHYAVKSKEEYEEKMNRSNAMGQPKGWEFWNHVHELPHVVCDDLAKRVGATAGAKR